MNLDHYKSQFDSFISGLADEPKTVLDDRKNAFNKFIELGLPSKKDELWQFTDLSTITKNKFDLIQKNGSAIDLIKIKEISLPDSNIIIIENGFLNTELSSFDNKIKIKDTQDDAIIALKLGDETNSFISLNRAFVNGGYFIEIPDNYISDKTIHIINISNDNRNNIQSHQLNIIKVGKNSSASVIEEFVSKNNHNHFYNLLNNIELSENSNFNYSVFQNNTSDIIQINNVFVNQKSDSTYNAQFITKNGSLIRNDINVQIDGENCDTNISGLGLLDKIDHIENYTAVSHNKPHCNSNQLFKYILKDSAEGVFNGLVKVQPNAQKTDSQQTNRNILLSKKALMNSNPQLEIYADDVKCTHGSATGELDEDAIFYLRSRGIDQITAKSLLIEGFAKEVIDDIKNDTFRDKVNDTLIKWLAK